MKLEAKQRLVIANEASYQALVRAQKQAQKVVDKLTAAVARAKDGNGVMTADMAKHVEDALKPILFKIT